MSNAWSKQLDEGMNAKTFGYPSHNILGLVPKVGFEPTRD